MSRIEHCLARSESRTRIALDQFLELQCLANSTRSDVAVAIFLNRTSLSPMAKRERTLTESETEKTKKSNGERERENDDGGGGGGGGGSCVWCGCNKWWKSNFGGTRVEVYLSRDFVFIYLAQPT